MSGPPENHPLEGCEGIVIEVELMAEAFDPFERLRSWQTRLEDRPGGSPAASSQFIGRVRSRSVEGRPLEALELEHYPGMTESVLETMVTEAARSHGGVGGVLVVHRIGRVLPGEAIVLVAVAADRRGPSQRCTRDLLEALKHDAPFWKREWTGPQGRWITANTPWREESDL